MKNKRRTFFKLTGLSWVGSFGFMKASGLSLSGAKDMSGGNEIGHEAGNEMLNEDGLSVIGVYGDWAAGLTGNSLQAFSFRRTGWKNRADWQKAAKKRLEERMAIPDIGPAPKAKVIKEYSYDGLHIQEISWQLPYGRATEAIVLKPLTAKGRLPGILAFHDHGGDKYFGTEKITRTSGPQSVLMEEHQQQYYEGLAWANEIARRGYVVMVSDAFPFASRRVMIQDVPVAMRQGLDDRDPGDVKNIKAYNEWAALHEHVMAKSLFSSGTTWPGVFFAEDRIALDILCAREDVDVNNIGCGGLSGGGMRSVFLAGLDQRIKCAVSVGFMTTWRDLVLSKSISHTWMTYVPLLPNELDFPEIFGLAVPAPIMVLNNGDDQLFTLDEMKRADQMLASVYEKAHAADQYKCSFHPGPHKFDRRMQSEAFDWFDKWLKR
jgi:dienelactone hydrolase